MTWRVFYLPEAQKDLKGLAGNQRSLVIKAIEKVRKNPLPDGEGGYGKPLGHHNGKNLSGFLKIKLRDAGLRVVYQIQRTETEMLIIVIGARADDLGKWERLTEGRVLKAPVPAAMTLRVGQVMEKVFGKRSGRRSSDNVIPFGDRVLRTAK